MGLAASQGRMLLLTARKSDLEFRAQQISQKRLILAQQLETISSDYEDATSNREMSIKLYSTEVDADGNPVKKISTTKALTYANLVSGAASMNGEGSGIQKSSRVGTDDTEYTSNTPYRLKNFDGAIVISDVSEIPNFLLPEEKEGKLVDKNGSASKFHMPDGSVIQFDRTNTTTGEGKWHKVNKDGGKVEYNNFDLDEIMKTCTKIEFPPTKNDEGKDVARSFTKKDLGGGLWEYTGPDNQKYLVDPGLKDTSAGPNYLQDCLRNGKYLLQKTSTSSTEWKDVSWDAATNIKDSYYSDDDDEAKAKYDRLQAEVQAQDKKLELELDNVETQRNAVQTEMDSVSKVMDENIEKTFNAFG